MTDETLNATLDLAQQTLRELLEKMQAPSATVAAHWSETEEDGTRAIWLEAEGEGLDFLVGPKGETLDALQMLVRLMLGRQLTDGQSLVVDVQGYRRRRADQLQRLAQRMAEQAVRLSRTMTLEPMTPGERRLVHLALRDNPQVRTESVGEGLRRKVTIIPQQPK